MRKNLGSPSAAPPGRADAEFAQRAEADLFAFIGQADFPCVGAKAAFNSHSYVIRAYEELADDSSSIALGEDLRAFLGSELRMKNEYSTFIAVFREAAGASETKFEEQLWLQLGKLNRIDAMLGYEWDPAVESDPRDPHFSFSFAGQALYVVGMHRRSSRPARRFRWPALVFNPHEQFERLRADGKWKRMQATIRTRDIHLAGNVNPMLSDFGERSEARQYSGRAVGGSWKPHFRAEHPGTAARCPFAH